MDDWYVYVGDREIGPFSTEDAIHFVRGKNLSAIYVWREGFSEWKPADDVPEFRSLRTSQRPPPPLNIVPEREGAPVSTGDRKGAWARNGALVGLALTILMIATGSRTDDVAFVIGRLIGGSASGLFAGFLVGVLFDRTRKRALDAAHTPDAEPNRASNFIVLHWRGALPLWVSYWCISFLVNLAFLFVGALLDAFDIKGSYHPGKIFLVILSIWILVAIVCVWQFVGVWRSASNYSVRRIRESRSTFWGIVAQIVVAFGAAGTLSMFARQGVPQVTEAYRMAFMNDPSMPDYSIRVMRDGTEAEIVGGIKYGLTDDFAKILNASPRIKVLHLDSAGGRVGEAERLFELIRSRGLDTYVASKCHSACTLAFVGGRRRFIAPKGELGFHRGSFAGQEEKDDIVQRRVLRRAGVDEAFIDKAMSTPNKIVYRPPIDSLIKSRIVTEVAEADKFAYSGLGGNVDRDEVARIFEKVSPIFEALKEKYPARYQSLIDEYVEAVTQGKSQAETLEKTRAIFLPFIQSLVQLADDDVIIRYNALMIEQLAALSTRDASLCHAFAAGDTVPGNFFSHFSDDLREREQQLQAMIIRTAAPKIQINDAEADKLYAAIGERLKAKGLSVDVILQAGLPKSRHAEQCNVVMEFYRELGKLPRKDQASLLRYTWAQR